jgi:vancomycin resistance protein YoaR
MLKSAQGLLASLLLIFISLGASLGALYAYGAQKHLPTNFTVSGWKVGGSTYEQFEQQFQDQLLILQRQKVRLASSNPEWPTQELTLAQLGVKVDKEKVDIQLHSLFEGPILQRIQTRWKLNSMNLELKPFIDAPKLTAAIEQTWKELYKKQPIAAKRTISSTDEVIYEPEKPALRIDADKLRSALDSVLPRMGEAHVGGAKLQVNLPIYEKWPDITIDSLKKQGISRKIIEFTTALPSSGEGRLHNISSTASSIHDLLLAPGDIFDYSKIIEKTESQFGYREAPVILNGKLVPGIGGGICQVSTTLYNAVLRSGLDIVERRNHSLPISYAPLGQDATFASGYINFKFRNSSGSYLLIRTSMSDKQMTVKLFGQLPNSVTYDIESKIIETIDPPTKFVYNPTLKRGKTEKISQGKAGYVVETYRYKKENGNVVGKELVSKDHYSPQPTVFAMNNGQPPQPGADNPSESPSIIEDGVKGPTFP